MAHRFSRKNVADKLNESAMQAVVVANQVLNGEVEGINANARLGAAKLILNKVVPDIRSVEMKMEDIKIKHTVEFK